MTTRPAFYTLLALLFYAQVATAQPVDVPHVAEFEEGTVTSVDDVEINYQVGGEGDTTLLFIHCWTCDRTFWREQLGVFAEDGYRVVALDLAGHGTSDKGRREAWTMDAYGEDVAAVADELDLSNVILIGHSMGGSVAIEAAEELEGRVAGIVLVDSFRDPEERMSDEEMGVFVEALKADFSGTTESLVRQYMFAPGSDSVFVDSIVTHMASADPIVGIGSMEHIFRLDYREVLSRLDVPVKAINAGYVPTNLESMQRYGIEVAILPDVGHFLIFEAPERFNELLSATLAAM